MEFKGSLMFIMAVIAMMAAPISGQDPSVAVARANTQFTTDFYSVVSKPAGGSGTSQPTNLIFSPFSLSACIGMLKAGAGGVTATEIQRGMHYPSDDILNKGYEAQLKGLKSNENFTLETANSVYTKVGFKLAPRFQTIVTQYFNAKVEQLDFSDGSGSAHKINGFVERVTHDKIKDLISPSDLNQDTRLVLVNAIYFKGLWKHKFDKSNTAKEKFHVSPGKTVEVDMMKNIADFKYGEIQELDAKVVALPYKGDRLSMIVILPNKQDGLVELEEKLKTYDLGSIQNKLYERKVDLSMPKFRLESEIDLQNPLEALGMKSMFDQSKADLSLIPDESNNQGLYVSKAIQKAFLEVNEEGSEAAAATATQITLKSAIVSKTKVLRLDHPFVAFIQDFMPYGEEFARPQQQHLGVADNYGNQQQDGEANVLFMTRLSDPTVAGTALIGGELRAVENGAGTGPLSAIQLLLTLIPAILIKFLF